MMGLVLGIETDGWMRMKVSIEGKASHYVAVSSLQAYNVR